MMESKEAWLYYHNEVGEKIDLNIVLETAKSVYSILGFKLSNFLETYATRL